MKIARAESGLVGWICHAWWPYALLLGLYLTLRGYHSFDGDQAYRLPLLLHRQDPTVFADDPFVRAFDHFNPHRGSLALLDALSRPFGLPVALFAVFVLTFLATCRAVMRLARAVWPDLGVSVGWLAVGLFLISKAGNIGTNHLFEAMVLDRLVAMALGWQAIADAVTRPRDTWWRSALWIALSTLIHPSVGLQLAMLMAASWLGWALLAPISRVNLPTAIGGLTSLGIAVVPGLSVNLLRGSTLQGGLPDRLFWILSVELQSPQHMLPHLWRMPQWLAWFGYLVLGMLAITSRTGRPADDPPVGSDPEARAPRWRLAVMLATIAIGLGAAWAAIEVGHNIRATVFQPFRLSTVARGMSLVFISGRLLVLWRGSSAIGRVRAIVLATGFLGDWLLVVATVAETSVSAVEAISRVVGHPVLSRVAPILIGALMIAMGGNFLAHHDTESGHIPLMIALAAGIAWMFGIGRSRVVARLIAADEARWRRRVVAAVCASWVVPGLALLASMIPPHHPAARLSLVESLVNRCRFAPMPLDDIERLALWCREHTPASALFIGPPGPKTFRLWSRRSLAFNRSGSPYHGAGLADWFARFQDHVQYRGSPEEFVRAYRDHRHEFEARYDRLGDEQRAALAVRQGAQYIIARAPKLPTVGKPEGPLEVLHVEGDYAAYRVNPPALVRRQP